MGEGDRELLYSEAISEALVQAMEADDRVFVMGAGVDDPKGIFGSTLGPYKRFGRSRVFDVPLAENAMAGVGVGAALAGMRPVIVHARGDFLMLTMDQLVNNAAKWRYMSGGRLSVPLTVRALIGRGWGQAAQHSQSLQALFAHVPGLKVLMPSTPYDVKGLMISSIQDDGPVIVLEHRWLYGQRGFVPEEPYSVPIGKGSVVRKGSDITVVATSLMVHEAVKAATLLEEEGIELEIIDLRSIRPWDEGLVLQSVARTRRLLVADTGWRSFGVSAEVTARAAEELWGCLKAPIRRVTLPDTPTPCSSVLEQAFYPKPEDVAAAARPMMEGAPFRSFDEKVEDVHTAGVRERGDREFRGPF